MILGGPSVCCANNWLFWTRIALMAKVTAVTTVFPDTGLPQVPTQCSI